MTHSPLISVIIPVYNADKYVQQAIESVCAQTYHPIEIICVNDGSTDHSLEKLHLFGKAIRVVSYDENRGIGYARNQGLLAARGEYIAFLDADDYWQLEKLVVQMRYLVENPTYAAVFTMMQCFVSPELPEEIKKLRFCPPAPTPGYIAGTALIRKQVFETVGRFGEQWRIGEFIDWLARVDAAGIVYGIVPDVFLARRIHTTNSGITDRSSRGDYLKIVRQALDRKRRHV